MVDVREWPGPERRTSLRLRKLIDDLQAGQREHRVTLDTVLLRLNQLAADVEALKKVQSRIGV
jgi:hypothetical protein